MNTFKVYSNLMTVVCAALISSSAGASPADASLQITWNGADSTSYLIPLSARSCFTRTDPDADKNSYHDVPENVLQIEDFQIEWSDTETDFYVESIKLILKDIFSADTPPLEITIEGNELASLDGTHGLWSKSLPHAYSPSVASKFTAKCPLLFGRANAGKYGDFQAYGVIELTGFSHNYDGTDTPIKIQKNITLVNFRSERHRF